MIHCVVVAGQFLSQEDIRMSQYKHRMTLAVPAAFIPQANQLALIAGESPDDVNTFTSADYEDTAGNKYAVCSAVIKPIVLTLFGASIVDSPLQAEGADVSQAQQAMDVTVMYEQDMKATPDKIVIAIDIDPMAVFESLGLTLVIDGLSGIDQ